MNTIYSTANEKLVKNVLLYSQNAGENLYTDTAFECPLNIEHAKELGLKNSMVIDAMDFYYKPSMVVTTDSLAMITTLDGKVEGLSNTPRIFTEIDTDDDHLCEGNALYPMSSTDKYLKNVILYSKVTAAVPGTPESESGVLYSDEECTKVVSSYDLMRYFRTSEVYIKYEGGAGEGYVRVLGLSIIPFETEEEDEPNAKLYAFANFYGNDLEASVGTITEDTGYFVADVFNLDEWNRYWFPELFDDEE